MKIAVAAFTLMLCPARMATSVHEPTETILHAPDAIASVERLTSGDRLSVMPGGSSVAGQPLELMPVSGAEWRFPELVHDPVDPDIGHPCKGVRARYSSELASPWRSVVRRIAFRCEKLRNADGDPDAEWRAHAMLRPNAVTFGHIPVTEVITSETSNASRRVYVLAQPYVQAARRLRPSIEARSGTPMRRDADTGNLVVEAGCENGLLELGPDKSNRQQTLFSISCEAD